MNATSVRTSKQNVTAVSRYSRVAWGVWLLMVDDEQSASGRRARVDGREARPHLLNRPYCGTSCSTNKTRHMSAPGSSDTRTRARRLESELDSKLVQLSRLDDASQALTDARNQTLMQEIERLLADLAETNDAMSREAADAPGGAATMHKLQRHREILHDLQSEFAKSKANLHAANERSQLLSSVREDIREHRCAASRASDALLRERNAINASGRAADEILGQAAATRDQLAQQRGGFGSMSGKLKQLSSLAPQIGSLLGAISRRQKRDKIIIACVIGVCTAILIINGFG